MGGGAAGGAHVCRLCIFLLFSNDFWWLPQVISFSHQFMEVFGGELPYLLTSKGGLAVSSNLVRLTSMEALFPPWCIFYMSPVGHLFWSCSV